MNLMNSTNEKSFSLAGMRVLKQGEIPEIRARIAGRSDRDRPFYRLPDGKTGTGIIAEVKKASPSGGEIKAVSPARQAAHYVRGGAAAISVLTDKYFFKGAWEDLEAVCEAAALPVLCKEFIYHEEQVHLACLFGADMVLLIARALERDELRRLYGYAHSLGITPLVEIHHESELEDVLELNPTHLLVNMRNLETLGIDFAAGVRTLRAVPAYVTPVCASGITNRDDIIHIRNETGTRLFLIGTSLMRSDNPEEKLREYRDVR